MPETSNCRGQEDALPARPPLPGTIRPAQIFGRPLGAADFRRIELIEGREHPPVLGLDLPQLVERLELGPQRLARLFSCRKGSV